MWRQGRNMPTTGKPRWRREAQPAASRMRRSSTATALCWEERDEPAHLREGRAFAGSTCCQSGTRSILAMIIDPRCLLVVNVDPIKLLNNVYTRQDLRIVSFESRLILK